MTDKSGSGGSQAGGGTGGGSRSGSGAPIGKAVKADNPANPASEAHDGIAQNLRKVYQSTVDEPVPDSIADLLSRLS